LNAAVSKIRLTELRRCLPLSTTDVFCIVFTVPHEQLGRIRPERVDACASVFDHVFVTLTFNLSI